jgi:hypothetical protein
MAHLLAFHPARAAGTIFLAASVLISAPTLSLRSFAAGEPLAVLAAVKGIVQVTPARGGPAQRATFGRSLERGDKVAVAAGGGATVFFNDGNVIELAEKSAVTIGGRVGGAKPVAGPAAGLPSEVYTQVAKFSAGGSRESGLVAQSQTRGVEETPFLIIAPRKTAVLTAKPSFEWRAVAGATHYRVTLSSAETGELWKRDATGLTLDYPADAAAIAAGSDCLWELEALSDTKSLRKESSVFQVIGAEQAGQIRANLDRIRESAGGDDMPAARYLAGSYLSGLGLYHDAAESFTALCRLSPKSAAPHEALGTLYRKVGLTDLAAAEFEQASSLKTEP